MVHTRGISSSLREDSSPPPPFVPFVAGAAPFCPLGPALARSGRSSSDIMSRSPDMVSGEAKREEGRVDAKGEMNGVREQDVCLRKQAGRRTS